MSKSRTSLSAAVLTAAFATSAVLGAGAAHAEAIVYQQRTVAAQAPGETADQAERLRLDIPTGYTRDRQSWHQIAWYDPEITIWLDLEPVASTVKKLRAERAEIVDQGGDSYREFSFTVNPKGSKVRARWVYTVTQPNTGDMSPYISVLLVRGNRLQVVGSTDDKDLAKRIRHDVAASMRVVG